MSNLAWLFGWAKDNGIEIPIDYEGRADIGKLLEIYREREKSVKTEDAADTIQKPERAYGFAEKKFKYSPDHIQHAKEMGYKNQDEYERAAIDFWDKGQGEIHYGDKRDRFVKYNEKTGEYVVVDKDGTLKTYYKISLNKFLKIKEQEGFKKWKK